MSRSFLLSGLVVVADAALPGAAPADAPLMPDIVVERAGDRTVPEGIADGRRLQAVTWGGDMQYSTVELDTGEVLLRLHGLADFVIDPDLRTVRAWTDPRCEPEMFGILVAGNLLATVLTLRGETVLHASAVEVGGLVVAFVGHSGMGKSTLAALACDRGARLVTDDLLRLSFADGEPVRCWTGGAENRLRLPLDDLVDGDGLPIRVSVDGRFLWQPARTREPRPGLAAVVIPVRDLVRPASPPPGVETSLLAPGAAVLELARRPRLLGWTDPVARARQFTNLARLVRTVPVLTACVPWGPPFAPEMIGELLAAAGAPLSGTRMPAS